MAEVVLFGCTRDDVQRYVPRMAFDAQSAPTDTQADAIILAHAADICGWLYGMGVNPTDLDALPSSALYIQAQSYILMKFAAQVMRLRNANANTLANELEDRADALRERMRKTPTDMGEQRPTGPNAPNQLHTSSTYEAEAYARSLRSNSRLAINAAVDKL